MSQFAMTLVNGVFTGFIAVYQFPRSVFPINISDVAPADLLQKSQQHALSRGLGAALSQPHTCWKHRPAWYAGIR